MVTLRPRVRVRVRVVVGVTVWPRWPTCLAFRIRKLDLGVLGKTTLDTVFSGMSCVSQKNAYLAWEFIHQQIELSWCWPMPGRDRAGRKHPTFHRRSLAQGRYPARQFWNHSGRQLHLCFEFCPLEMDARPMHMARAALFNVVRIDPWIPSLGLQSTHQLVQS